MKHTLGWLALGLAVSACGGGGKDGGGSGGSGNPPPVVSAPEVKVLSGGITRYVAQNSSIAFDVQIKPSFTPTGTLSVNASDKAGVIQPQVTVTPNTDGSYVLSLGTATGAAPGHYTGDITLKLCADAACAAAQAVPSVTVPYDLTVAAPGSAWQGDHLTALSPWTSVADWVTFQGNAAHTGYMAVEIKPDQIGPRWKAGAIDQAVADSYGYTATLTAANGIFYSAGNNILKARKEFDGSLVWSYDVSGLTNPSVNPPSVDNGVVYMAAG